MDRRHAEAEQTKQALEQRIKQELAMLSRLKMSTIGSSHKLFSMNERDNDNEGGLAEAFGRLVIVNEEKNHEGVVVIFDESGCIPSFELLGLSRLACPISAILCVGDKKQLPPYNPGNDKRPKGRAFGGEETGLQSLLDVCALKEKIALRTQYRVPRDIARILDTRVYCDTS
jgi:ATP-dependent exoDNAse (exonuclease V) alpha subunit